MSQTIGLSHSLWRNDERSKTGVWLFIFTELLLFAGLFIVYGVYRYLNPVAFHLAAEELSVSVGTVDTIMLLASSTCMAMAGSAIRMRNKGMTMLMLVTVLFIAFMFLVNRYFEWQGKIGLGLFPGSPDLLKLGNGDVLFFGLYFFLTGLHAVHVLVGFVLITIVTVKVNNNSLTADNPILLNNSGLYWHLVVLIWIFLFPLFYLIT